MTLHFHFQTAEPFLPHTILILIKSFEIFCGALAVLQRVVGFFWMWGHWHLNRLSSDSGGELVGVSLWAVIEVVVMCCVCAVVGAWCGPPTLDACRWPGSSYWESFSRLGVGSGGPL
ncbi:hypothetical protein ATANTOWER_023468 [Ataeniobius toweri]|uniref:Transmembrane protein n=1 Tax=Ataeniobius toweri TaxID=208326 RepID=A0ABU7ATV4_9TELE|nr:hypothetical protein [Ataeniobius toweri]